ncbi:hypothetical protein RI367_005507 [Sorochytrium milnesiophthora]
MTRPLIGFLFAVLALLSHTRALPQGPSSLPESPANNVASTEQGGNIAQGPTPERSGDSTNNSPLPGENSTNSSPLPVCQIKATSLTFAQQNLINNWSPSSQAKSQKLDLGGIADLDIELTRQVLVNATSTDASSWGRNMHLYVVSGAQVGSTSVVSGWMSMSIDAGTFAKDNYTIDETSKTPKAQMVADSSSSVWRSDQECVETPESVQSRQQSTDLLTLSPNNSTNGLFNTTADVMAFIDVVSPPSSPAAAADSINITRYLITEKEFSQEPTGPTTWYLYSPTATSNACQVGASVTAGWIGMLTKGVGVDFVDASGSAFVDQNTTTTSSTSTPSAGADSQATDDNTQTKSTSAIRAVPWETRALGYLSFIVPDNNECLSMDQQGAILNATQPLPYYSGCTTHEPVEGVWAEVNIGSSLPAGVSLGIALGKFDLRLTTTDGGWQMIARYGQQVMVVPVSNHLDNKVYLRIAAPQQEQAKQAGSASNTDAASSKSICLQHSLDDVEWLPATGTCFDMEKDDSSIAVRWYAQLDDARTVASQFDVMIKPRKMSSGQWYMLQNDVNPENTTLPGPQSLLGQPLEKYMQEQQQQQQTHDLACKMDHPQGVFKCTSGLQQQTKSTDDTGLLPKESVPPAATTEPEGNMPAPPSTSQRNHDEDDDDVED